MYFRTCQSRLFSVKTVLTFIYSGTLALVFYIVCEGRASPQKAINSLVVEFVGIVNALQTHKQCVLLHILHTYSIRLAFLLGRINMLVTPSICGIMGRQEQNLYLLGVGGLGIKLY